MQNILGRTFKSREEEKLRQYLRPAGIGLVVIGLALFTPPVYAEVRNLEAVFGLDPLIFPPIGVVLVFIGALLIDRGWQ